MAKTKTKTLLDIFLEMKKLSGDDMERIRKAIRMGADEEDAFLNSGFVDENEVLKAKVKLFGIPAAKVEEEKIEPELFKEVTEEAVKQYGFIPLARRGGFFEFGLLRPDDFNAQEAARFVASEQGLAAKFYVITKRDFNAVVKRYQDFRGEVRIALEELETELEKGKTRRKKVSDQEVEKIIKEAPATKVVAVILRHAVEGRASDVHIEPTTKNLRVRFRVDGVLYTTFLLPLHVHSVVVSRIKILSQLKIDETRVPQDGRFRTRVGDKEIDVRVSTFPTTEGEKVAMRILDPATGLLTLPDLGLAGRNLETVTRATARPFGMILVSGPTGSGKTTTLYALLQIINKEDVNVMSLEDPVEYYIDGVNQSQVKPEIGYDFARGLRHMVRQDPDIIMVGEIRDKETAALATHAALTGHIVLSTIHTNNVTGIIPRLIDMGVERYLISPSLAIGLAQRLVRRLCNSCKRGVEASKIASQIILAELNALPEEYRKQVDTTKPLTIYEAPGCPECFNKGYVGRIALFEVLEMTPRLEEIIVEAPTEMNIEKEAKNQGMITMKQDGILKVLQGVASLEEILKVVE